MCKTFVSLIFVDSNDYQNLSTTNISQFTNILNYSFNGCPLFSNYILNSETLCAVLSCLEYKKE